MSNEPQYYFTTIAAEIQSIQQSIQNDNVQIMDNDIHNLTEQRLTGLKTKDAARYMRRLGIGIIFATLLSSMP